MDRRLVPFIVTAFFAVVISIFAFSLIDSNNSEPTAEKNPINEQKKGSNEDSNGGGSDSDSDITNNVQNNVNGENAEIDNSIDNKLKDGSNNQIENDVSNNIEVNVDVKVKNNINNDVNGHNSNSDSSNSGKDSENGKNEDNNDDKKGNDNENGKSEEDKKGSDNKEGKSEEDKKGNEDGKSEEDKVVWGVDSASGTSNDLLSCVRDNFGSPEIWGRYLGEKEGVSVGLTSDEVDLLHSSDIKILVIWNHFTDATGNENGQNEARQAIQKAKELGIPEGVAIFADIEPSYPVDSEFIKGWFEIMKDSEYESGIYGIFDSDKALSKAFEQAASDNEEILKNNYIWTAAPNVGITAKSEAPEYKPEAPKNTLIGGWQYGIDAKACNIDTNLFHSDVIDVLW